MQLRKFMLAVVAAILLLVNGVSLAQSETARNKQLLAEFGAEVFGKKNLDNLDKYMHDDYIQHNPLVAQGSAGFKAFFGDWFKAVPDWNYEVKQIVAEGDTVWVYGTYSGTQRGEWLGIAPSDRTYRMRAVDIFRIADGKLAEHWDVIDVYGLFKQLGVLQ